MESGGQPRRSVELGEWSRLPGAEQHGVLAGREEAAAARGALGGNVWF